MTAALPPSDRTPPDLLPRRAGGGREALGWLLLVGAVIGVLLLGMAPTPYVIERPGTLFDTLGEVESRDGSALPLIEVDGAETFPVSGGLELVTVSLLGSPDRPTSWIEVIQAWFQPGATVLPLEAVFPPGQTSEESNAQSAAQMESSQQEAIAAALAELGIPFDTTVEVHAVLEDGPADGVLEEGDVLLAVDGEPVAGGDSLRALIGAHGAGTPLELTLRRDGAESTVSVTPRLAEDGATPIVGVIALTGYDFPIDVDIQLENVGGPSAGLMFALGVYDLLTPGALTGGERIAGTGTISAAGAVGRIGGLRQKMHAAVLDAGVEWFLVPTADCPQAGGAVPDGLEVVAVSTLDEAIAAVGTIAADGEASALPRCPAG